MIIMQKGKKMNNEQIPPNQPVEINPDNALTVLIDILSNTPLWNKDPNVKICCKSIGAKIIEMQSRIDNAISILQK